MTASSAPLRVLLVDDSLFARRALRRMLSREEGIAIVGEASDGREALELCRALDPDAIVLDIEMPVLDGLGVLDALAQWTNPPAVVVVSGAAQADAELTILALEKGAFDFVDKSAVSSMELHLLAGDIASKLQAAVAYRRRSAARRSADGSIELPEILVIGASTGGPQALFKVLGELPADFPVPIAVVQHIPQNFLGPLLERMAEKTPLAVREGIAGEAIRPGEVVFAGGRKNLGFIRKGSGLSLVQREAEPGTPHVPSIDALFLSAARVCGERTWGVLLTGMGRDGAEGLLEIRKRGGWTIAQDEATSAVWGMPRAAVALGAASEILPLPAIGRELARAASALAKRLATTGQETGATT